MAGTSFKNRRGTAQAWALSNPVLGEGELGEETDTGVVKIGNGVDPWNTLRVILGTTYLGINAKAADADKLDGYDSTAFTKVVDADNTYLKKNDAAGLYLPTATAAATYQRQDAMTPSATTATANTLSKRDASANTAHNEVMLNAQTTAASATRKDYVDAIGSSASAANTVVRRDGTNSFGAGNVSLDNSPTAANHAARKDYVDKFTDSGQLSSSLSTQSIPTSTWTIITSLNQVSGSLHGTITSDLTTGKLIIAQQGTFFVGGVVSWTGSTAGNRRLGAVYKNGLIVALTTSAYPVLGSQPIYPVSGSLVECGYGDYIQLAGWQDSGAALTAALAYCSLFVLRTA